MPSGRQQHTVGIFVRLYCLRNSGGEKKPASSVSTIKPWKFPSNIVLNHQFRSILGPGLEFEFSMQYF